MRQSSRCITATSQWVSSAAPATIACSTSPGELRRFLVKAVEAGVTGKQDVKQALDQACAIWNKKLAPRQVAR